MKINQNISAVIVNDQLLRNENSVAASVKKLSSGLKFNEPKDNPSGMAISFKMQAQIHALNRASLNATDGTSMVETIDGAMGEMTEVLQRIRELCVQAANDTNGLEDREAIQQEIDALKEEVNRISSATEFNGKKLLDGSLDRRTYVTETVIDATTGVSKEVSMFDRITNVIISDEVQAGNYNATIEKTAEHADIITETGDMPAGGTVISEDEEGIICINGSAAQIKAGMSADDVYAAIRNAGEMGWVNVFATNGTQDPTINLDNLDRQGYQIDETGYQFGDRLAFISQNYGTDEKVTITCDNEKLAKILGIDTIAGVEVEEEYSLVSNPGKDGDAAAGTAAESAKLESTTKNDRTLEFLKSGTVIINGISIDIEEKETISAVCSKITAALSVNNSEVSCVDDGNSLTFTSKSTGSDAKISITYDSTEIGDNLGFNNIASADLESQEHNIISYKAEKAGTNAEVSIKVTNNSGVEVIREEYTGQAVVKTDGNQVVITDKSGFEMSFEVRADVAQGKEIKIEATDIGTLQLQIGANEGQELAVRVPVLNTQSLYMDDLDVRKVGGPDRGIDAMDTAIAIVSAARSLMGSYENRLDYVQSSLDETEENMTKAVSRLGDVDMAEEMTEYTNSNVLTQASISVLAQANDLPQQVLSLLQG